MTEEIDIWRSADLLMQQYGSNAELVAARRIDDMIARGAPDGEATWKQILQAIRELQRTGLRSGERIN